MPTYNTLELFSSGPSRVEPGEVQARDALAQVPGAVGGSVIGQGTELRTLIQRGRLIADNEPSLRSLIAAIQAQVGRGAADLIDEYGHTWPGCVMRRLDHGPVERMGPRVTTGYTVTYLQTSP